jgi:hypothetical protein
MLCTALMFLAHGAMADTYTWAYSGGGTGLWSSGANWGGTPPGSTDVAAFNSATGLCLVDMAVTVAGLQMSTGTVMTTTNAITVNGDVTLTGGTLTHRANSTGETYRLVMTVNGNVTVDTNGVISANGLGYLGGYGPGHGTGGGGTDGLSGGYGGCGTGPNSLTYGSVIAPTNLGSGAPTTYGSAGGGAIRLDISGVLTNHGTISANGKTSTGYGAGSGGSVWITAGSISGSTSGVIRAHGGAAYYNGGGGGRVAVSVTNVGANFGGYAGGMTAYAGTSANGSPGAAGTVYQETQAMGTGHGILLVDANNVMTWNPAVTLMPPNVNLSDFSQVTIRNKGNLGVGASDTLDFGSASLAVQSTAGSFVTLFASNGVSFPNPYVISNYTLLLDSVHSASGNWIVAANGLLSHSPNSTSETFKLDLTLAGNLTVVSNGAINADGLGYRQAYGPGKGSGTAYTGGGHGGCGGGTNAPGGLTYGSIVTPTNAGSGTASIFGSPGGGIIILHIAGALTNHGTIAASGNASGSYGAGSGGSVNITAGSLAGYSSAIIRANGGWSYQYGPGGGGRVAVSVTNAGADFSTYAGIITAYGGARQLGIFSSGSAGTVFKQTPTNRICLVANFAGATTGAGVLTDVKSPQELFQTTVLVTNNTCLTLATNVTVGNLFLQTTNSIMDLAGYTLRIQAREHALTPGYATNFGAIVWWKPGTIFAIR